MDTITKHSNSLSDFFTTSELFSLNDLLNKIINYGLCKLGCKGGSLFFFDGGTAKLELSAHSYSTASPLSFSLSPGEGVAGYAFIKQTLVIASGMELTRLYLPFKLFPRDRLRGVVALPVFVFKKPIAVFCFDFISEHLQPGMDQNAENLTSEEKSAVQELWKEFDSSDIGMLIHQKRVIQVQNDLLCAGTAPSDLRKESGKFILGLKKAYEKSDWPCPDLIYLQLVDHPQKAVRTVHGFGMPLSFKFQPAYSLDSTKDSTDIHVKIVKTRQVRIIAGNDKRHFNQRIYKHYQHEKYVRLWFPLFPFPVPSDISGSCKKIETELKALLRWNPKETRENSMKQWVAEFSEKKRPPENLIFGTVEIGYRRKTRGNLSLKPWTKDLVIWSMAQAYQMSRDLFNITLPGVLDQIGRLLASLTQGDNIRFKTSFSYGKVEEVRTYPISAPWPAAVPESKKVSSNDSQTLTFESVTVERFKKNPMGIGFPTEYMEHLLKFNMPVAIRGVEAASHLFKAAIYPQELLVPDDDTIFSDTLIEENEIRSVCEEAAKMTGALCCGAYLFAQEPFPGHEGEQDGHWRIRPPIISGDKIGDDSFWKRVEDLAKEVVTKKTVRYLDESESLDARYKRYKMILLPLELSDTATGILVLFFEKEKTFSNLEKSDLERRVPRWVYRIYMNQLILRNRFSGLTAQLRSDIAEAKKTVESNCSASSCVTLFIKDVLQRMVERQSLPVGWLTLYSESATGLNRLERFWCLQEEGSKFLKTYSHEFINSSLIGPCFDACEKQRPVIYSGKKKEERIENLREKLETEIKDLQKKGESDSSVALQRFLGSFRRKEESSTILTFPVIKRGDDRTTFKGAYTTILKGEHYYDGEHRKLLTELGELLSENLNYVRYLDRKQSEKKFRKSLEELRKNFAHANDADGVVGALLHKLGTGKTGKASATLEIAEDIVFWFLSPESSKLVVRSAKGKGLDVFENHKNYDVLPCNKHPLFVKEEKNIERSSSKTPKLPRLKKGDFPLWTIPLGKKTQEKNTTYEKICAAYTSSTDQKWLITFPIVDAEARIFGVIDCLRDKPLPVEEENVLKRFLRRISLQFYSAFSNSHFTKVRRLRKELFDMTGKMLPQFRTEDVYQKLVRYIREEFVCKDCDLFLDSRGKMLLRSTTREHGPASNKDRSRFSVEPDTKKNEIMGNCLHAGKVQIKHVGKSPISSKNVSSSLQELFSSDFQSERMVIPLKGMIHGDEKVIGMLQLRQPLHHSKNSSKKKFEKEYLKKSLLFTSEDFRLGIDLGLAIQRIVQMVSLVEQQRLLLNELTHSLVQPLQLLRSAIDQLVKAALRDDKTKSDIKKLFDEITTMFDLAHEANEQLGFLTRLGQHDEKHQFEQINLKTLVQECCDLMAKRDFIRKNRIRIDCSGVQSIESLPVVTSWMRKTLLNLLDNAIKYSLGNRNIMIIATENDQGRICIKVTNWGVGIPEEDQQCVFDPYFRSDMPDAKGPRPGKGIGLMIVKEAVKRIHNGRVTVTSVPYIKSEKSTKQIIDLEHETNFTIELERKVLDSLANSVYLREKNSDGQPN